MYPCSLLCQTLIEIMIDFVTCVVTIAIRKIDQLLYKCCFSISLSCRNPDASQTIFPAIVLALTKLSVGALVMMLISSGKTFCPYTRNLGPLIISMRSHSPYPQAGSLEWCPVCMSLILIPLTRIKQRPSRYSSIGLNSVNATLPDVVPALLPACNAILTRWNYVECQHSEWCHAGSCFFFKATLNTVAADSQIV